MFKKKKNKKEKKKRINKYQLKTHEQLNCKMFNLTLFLNVLRGRCLIVCFDGGELHRPHTENCNHFQGLLKM